MNTMLKPTGLALVGVAFLLVCLYAQTGMALSDSPSYPDSLKLIKEFHSDFIHSEHSRYILDLKPSSSMLCSAPKKEKITMTGSRSKSLVQDLKAINTEYQRDITYDDMQRTKLRSQDQSNFMDIRIQGDRGRKDRSGNDFEDGNVEEFMGSVYEPGGDTGHGQAGNYMNIDVSGITVSAINTVEGGSAVATSNIIIEPVQIIAYPSEVEEKLR